MGAAGLIFSNIHDSGLPELTRTRTMASIPFGGRYRLIDFALSNLVNAGITRIGVVTHTNYRSLVEHIGSGAAWDLERAAGGIKILSPFITAYDNTSPPQAYASRLEALMGAMSYIKDCTEEYIVLSDCDAVCNVDIAGLLECHAASGADVTVVTKRLDAKIDFPPQRALVLRTDEGEKIIDAAEFGVGDGAGGFIEICANILVMRRSYLESAVADAAAHGSSSFYRDFLGRLCRESDFRVYRHEGYFGLISSSESYFARSMEMLDSSVRAGLLGLEDRQIMTKIQNYPPTKYGAGASAKNSLISDGCVIDGVVEDSVLFCGVKICKGARVRGCVLFEGAYVGAGAELECVIADKNVLIKDALKLSGCRGVPLYICKGKRL